MSSWCLEGVHGNRDVDNIVFFTVLEPRSKICLQPHAEVRSDRVMRPSTGVEATSDMAPKTGDNLLPNRQKLAENAQQSATGTIHFQFLFDFFATAIFVPTKQAKGRVANERQSDTRPPRGRPQLSLLGRSTISFSIC